MTKPIEERGKKNYGVNPGASNPKEKQETADLTKNRERPSKGDKK